MLLSSTRSTCLSSPVSLARYICARSACAESGIERARRLLMSMFVHRHSECDTRVNSDRLDPSNTADARSSSEEKRTGRNGGATPIASAPKTQPYFGATCGRLVCPARAPRGSLAGSSPHRRKHGGRYRGTASLSSCNEDDRDNRILLCGDEDVIGVALVQLATELVEAYYRVVEYANTIGTPRY